MTSLTGGPKANDYKHQIKDIHVGYHDGFLNDPYFTDPSNYLDLVVLIFLPLSECLQVVNVASGGDYNLASAASWCLAIGVCCAWFNILKFSRPFNRFGPFYAILSRIFRYDVPQFFTVFAAVIIPFAVVSQKHCMLPVTSVTTREKEGGWEREGGCPRGRRACLHPC